MFDTKLSKKNFMVVFALLCVCSINPTAMNGTYIGRTDFGTMNPELFSVEDRLYKGIINSHMEDIVDLNECRNQVRNDFLYVDEISMEDANNNYNNTQNGFFNQELYVNNPNDKDNNVEFF